MENIIKEALIIVHTSEELLEVKKRYYSDVEVLVRDIRSRIVQYLNAKKIVIYEAFNEQSLNDLPQNIFFGINNINFISPSGNIRFNQEKLDLCQQTKKTTDFLNRDFRVHEKKVEVAGVHRHGCVKTIAEGLTFDGFDVEINEQLCR